MAQFAWNHITFLYHQNPAKSGKGGTTCEFTMAMAWRSELRTDSWNRVINFSWFC